MVTALAEAVQFKIPSGKVFFAQYMYESFLSVIYCLDLVIVLVDTKVSEFGTDNALRN